MADLRNTYCQVIIDTLISFGITTKDKDIVVYDANTIYDIMEMLCNEIYDEIYEERKKIYKNTIINSKKPKIITKKQIEAGSIKRAHQKNDRGNLPSGISPTKFFDGIIDGLIDCDRTKDFAKNLLETLVEYKYPMPSEEMLKELEEFCNADDSSSSFEDFRKIVIDLLTVNKIPYSKLPTLGRNEISLQREGDAQESATNLICEMSPLAFSRRFFHAGARGIVDFDDLSFEKELGQLSRVFQNICTIEFKCKPESFDCTENLIISLKEWVKGCLQTSKNRDILKVKGPLGSYKNRLMQYLYLAIERDCDFVTPIYIDIASYEKAAEGNNGIDEKDFLDAFEKDIEKAEKIISESPNQKHLLFLDGIRDFSCRNESLYYSIKERIQNKDWYLIVCMDTDFTFNKHNKYDVHPLVSNSYECHLRIRSMALSRKQESIDFIRNCVDVFNIRKPDYISIEQIYANLVRLEFLNIDAYWLKYLLQTHINDIVNHKINISGLYNAITLNILGSYDFMKAAARSAFEFEYGSIRSDQDLNFDLSWRLMKRHRSILDFLIAKHYAQTVLSFGFKNNKDEIDKKQFEIFNMIIQYNLARFAFRMLEGNEDYEYLIMRVAKKHYNELTRIGKSELAFRIAGLKSKRRRDEGVWLIKKYLQQEIESSRSLSQDDFDNQKNSAFLKRSLYINLIYKNDREAFMTYFKMLLTDKMANSINRGFHLEYYGDKFFIPNKSLLDFEDDIKKGYNTFNKLCLVLNTRIIDNKDDEIFAAAIEITTLCHLIQARTEPLRVKKVFDVKPYISDCLRFLRWIVKRPQIKKLNDVVMYFNWVAGEFEKMLENSSLGENTEIKYYRATPFNDFSIAKSVERAGWVKKKIPNPENVVEHMYNCWLMGMLYLPETYYEDGYCKNTILQILLIHDLVEAKIGNIDRLDKGKQLKECEYRENLVMHSLLLSGTYPKAVDLDTYMEYWKIWDKKKGINYLIAKDIDNIQTIYQFCKYYLKYPDIFSEEDITYWLMGVDEIETDICKEIADILIVNNPLFEEILSIYNVDAEN